MRYVVSAVAILYAVLSLYASLPQWRDPARRGMGGLMTLGSLILVFAGIMELLARGWAWMAVAVGSLLICAAAILSGKRIGRGQLQHHAVRLLITVFLILGALFW